MRNQIYYTIALILIVLVSFISCDEPQGTTTLRLALNDDSRNVANSRDVIGPEGESLFISNYIVSGSGPNESSFTITTSSTHVDITNLLVGLWEIEVIGLNQHDTPISSGIINHNLTTKSNNVEVKLSSFVGEGSVDIGFYWSVTDYPNSTFEVELATSEGVPVTLEGFSVNQSEGYARLQQSLSSGSYDLKFKLFSDGDLLAGGVTVLRILDQKVSQCNLEVIVDKQAPNPTQLLIKNLITEPIEGAITNIGSKVLPQDLLSATFHQTSHLNSSIDVTWYLDGEFLGKGKTVDFKTYTGKHRLDAIVKSDDLGSMGGFTHPFTATVEDLNNVPTVVSSYTSADDSNLVGDNPAIFLYDGRLLVASTDALHLYEIKKDSLKHLKSFKSSSSIITSDPYPAKNISYIAYDSIRNIIVTTSEQNNCVAFYNYDSESKLISKIGAFDATSGFWSGSIINCELSTTLGIAVVYDTTIGRIYHAPYDFSEVQPFKSMTLKGPLGSSSLTFNATGDRFTLSNKDTPSFIIYELTYGLNGTYSIKESSRTTLSSSNSNGNFNVWRIDPVLHINLSDGLHLYTISDKEWQESKKITSGSTPIKNITYNTSLTKCWILEEGKISSYELLDGCDINHYGSLQIDTTNYNGITSSPLENLLALRGSNKLKILRISDL
ncbi:MAG: hypothetical protein ACOXZZ_03740 [Sphaerochaetaceae bacterium]|jgi:hypothetical protein